MSGRTIVRCILILVFLTSFPAGWVHAHPTQAETDLRISQEQAIQIVMGGHIPEATTTLGEGDLLISDMGLQAEVLSNAETPAVAYNPDDQEYLVVWSGDDSDVVAVNECEIFGQRINAITGEEVGTNDFRISAMGPDGNISYDAQDPKVVYNPTNKEYLVVWYGDDNTAPLVEGEEEIYGQRIDAVGNQVGGDDFRISEMGLVGNSSYDAFSPDVAYNSSDNEYLVVWYSDGLTCAPVDNEYEIFGQRLDAAGLQVGAGDMRISDMGPDGDVNYNAYFPSVAYNTVEHQYLIVWQGDDNTATLVDEENEIFGQRITATTDTEVAPNDFRISDMGPNGDTNYDAYTPAVAYNGILNQYLVVWSGDDDTAPLVDGEREIFGQRLAGDTVNDVGLNDFRISDVGPQGDTNYDAMEPALVYHPAVEQYLVVWYGDDNTSPLVNSEYEIFCQRLASNGADLPPNDSRISDMGPVGNSDYEASLPAIALNTTLDQYLVVWEGDDEGAAVEETFSLTPTPSEQQAPKEDDECEIYGQLLSAIASEIGTNDYRISTMGLDPMNGYARYPATAYNSTDNQYLVVWLGKYKETPSDKEIYGQRLDAATGAKIGATIRISDMGPDGDSNYCAHELAVAYNSFDNQYLVVWSGDDDSGSLVDGEYEIFGQRIDAATGAELGNNDDRLSEMGPDGDPYYDAYSPSVAYNVTENEYLIVWEGDDDTSPLVDDESEIFGQRINAANGYMVGTPDFRISDMGPNSNPDYDAMDPEVAFDSTNNQYLVVWRGDDNTASLVECEYEIFGQRIAGDTGVEVGTDDRLSDMGDDGNIVYAANPPDVAYNANSNRYLVVWSGNTSESGFAQEEYEIFAQWIDASTGSQVDDNDFCLSDMGIPANPDFDANSPAVSCSPDFGHCLVVWSADDHLGALVDNEVEIFGQYLHPSGDVVGPNDFRISTMGIDGSAMFTAMEPTIAYGSDNQLFLAAWAGDDNTPPLVDNQFEIFGHLLAMDWPLYLPAIKK
ncbi:MAG: hypothetical protein JXB15_12745 [Anaerolineales bacterium]|nr:hypothetical protein [Anaerolineales bacterium]